MDYNEMVTELYYAVEDGFNWSTWEVDFIESVFDWDGRFTAKQKDVIDRLYEKLNN